MGCPWDAQQKGHVPVCVWGGHWNRPISAPFRGQKATGGAERRVLAVLPPPAPEIGLGWGSGEGGGCFIAQPALLFRKSVSDTRQIHPCNHPHQQGPEPTASETGTGGNSGAHHGFHRALSPKSMEKEDFCCRRDAIGARLAMASRSHSLPCCPSLPFPAETLNL